MKISKISSLGQFGHYIDGLDFNHITPEEIAEIGKLHAKDLVTILRNVKINYDQYARMIQSWGEERVNKNTWRSMNAYRMIKKYGPPSQWPMNNPPPDMAIGLKYMRHATKTTPEGNRLLRITGMTDDQGNLRGIFTNGDLHWHANEAALLNFTPGVALMGDQKMVGSATGFVQTVDFYESLSESFRSELDEMRFVHQWSTGAINDYDTAVPEYAEFLKGNFVPDDASVPTPVVITTPGGIRGIRYSRCTVVGIEGMSREESQRIIDIIEKGVMESGQIYDHYYQQDNDICLFDQCVTLHRRIAGDPDRVAYRISFDYANVIDAPWTPYHQPVFAKEFDEEWADYQKVMKTGVESDLVVAY
jgi:alpha-ketoglutarate-dependent taurine dioxygenase